MSRLLRAIVLAAATAFSPLVIPPAGAFVPSGMQATRVTEPLVFLKTALSDTPANGNTITVNSGDSLQAALDAAVPGDTIVLQAGATFTGIFSIGSKTGGRAGEWIIIRSAGSLPAEGSRMTISRAGTYNIAKILSPFATTPLIIANGSRKIRLVGIELGYTPSVTFSGQPVLAMGTGDAADLASMATDTIVDRCYIHGADGLDIRRGIEINGARQAVIDCTIENIHSINGDAQAILGWNGPGPFKITNNFLEANSETVNFGGTTPVFTGNVPSDIELRYNHITRRMAWKATTASNLEKNLIEFKLGRRVLIEGNYIDNAWYASQQGWALVLWSVDQLGNNPLAETCHVTVRNNIIKNCAAGLQISGFYTGNWPNIGIQCHDITVYNNVFIGQDNSSVSLDGNGQSETLWQVSFARNVSIEHNTVITPWGRMGLNLNAYADGSQYRCDNLKINNNVVGGPANYPIYIVDGGAANWTHVTGGTGQFTGNVGLDWGDAAAFYGLPLATNSFPTTTAAIGFVGGASAATDVNASPGDLALAVTSAYKGTATDGLDPGCVPSLIVSTVGDALGGN